MAQLNFSINGRIQTIAIADHLYEILQKKAALSGHNVDFILHRVAQDFGSISEENIEKFFRKIGWIP